jgi:hypothetical protein
MSAAYGIALVVAPQQPVNAFEASGIERADNAFSR